MSKTTRMLLSVGIVVFVYLVYLLGDTLTMTDNQVLVYVAPFFTDMNVSQMSSLVRQIGLLTLIIWVLWAIRFYRDERGSSISGAEQTSLLLENDN